MRINGVRCDTCNKEHLFHDNTVLELHLNYIPAEWFIIRNCGSSIEESKMFCSPKCLLDYAHKISGVQHMPVQESPPTTLHRFMLVDQEAEEIEGVRFSSGHVCVDFDPKHQPVFWTSWDAFKRDCQRYTGIIWIDPEVKQHQEAINAD